jgi:tricorn protease
LAYDKTGDNGQQAIWIYNAKSKTLKQATSGFYSDRNPVFDPDGKYLYLATNRNFQPVYSDFDNSWSYPNSTELAVITLTKETKSPLSMKNDTVAIAKAETRKSRNRMIRLKRQVKTKRNPM